ncbi:MAG: hypothetical protein KF819_08655 [Labilithrix sp.]|nr:hypothetical protein [Labilithrix sp.]
MAYRSISAFDLRELLLLWQAGRGVKAIARWLRLDPKTVRRYITLARARGVVCADDLTTELLDALARRPEPARGPSWAQLATLGGAIRTALLEGDPLTAIHARLGAAGVRVSYATLRRFARRELAWR